MDKHEHRMAEVEREQQLRSLISSTAEGIYGIDLEGNCTFANDACVRLLGYKSPDDLLGRHMHRLIHHTRPSGDPYHDEECRIYHAFRLGERVHADDEFYWRADGTSFHVEYWSYPQFRDAQIVGCVVTFLDISDRKKAEAERRERESLLQLAMKAGELGAFRWDVVTNSFVWTDQLYDLLGYTKEQFHETLESVTAIVHPEDRRQVRRSVRRELRSTSDRHDLQYRVIRGDNGRVVWLHSLGKIDRDAGGTPLRVTGVATDITKQKLAEIALRESEEFNRTVLESSPDCVKVVDPDGRLLTMNQNGQCQMEIDDFATFAGREWWTLWPAESQEVVRQSIVEAANAGTCRFQACCPTARGSIKHWDVIVTPVHSEHGSIKQFVAVSRDITKQRHWQTDLANRESHLRRVIDHALCFIGVLDTQGVLQEANEAAISAGGLTREDVIGKPFWECYWWSHDAQAVDGLKSAIQAALRGEVVRYDVEIRIAGESRLSIDFMLSPVKDTAGNVTHLIPSGVDISDRAHAEAALRESETRFRDLADNISQFAWMADAEGNVFWYNQRWFDYTGTTLEEMQGWGWKAVHHPDHLDRVVDRIQHAWDTGETWEDTFPLRAKSGEYRWFLSRAQPIRDDNGNILRWFGTNTDITETRQAVEALRASKEQLRLGVEVASFALVQIDYRTDLASLSREAARMYGFGDMDMVVTRQELHARFHPDDRPELLERIEESLDPRSDGELAIQHRIVLPRGEVRWLNTRNRVFFDRTVTPSQPSHGVVAAQDVTEEKRVELELADREAHLRRVINNQLGLVGVINRDGILVEVDDRSIGIAGLTRDDVIGKHFAECAWWTYDKNVSQQVRNAMTLAFAGETVRYDVALYAKGNQRLMIDFMIAPVWGDDGKIAYLIPSGVDISERKIAEEQLKEAREIADAANASKSIFLANMSHEIRTPMTAILGYTDLVYELVENQTAKQHLQTVKRNGEFLLEIINDILDLSKIEAGKFDISQEHFAPTRLLEDVRSIMAVRAAEKGLNLQIEYIGPIPAEIISDPKLVKQILINLVGNAIKFTQIGGVTVVVQCVTTAEIPHLQFEVIDTGIGITPEQQTRLFQPFSQGDLDVRRNFGGTGLGLAISLRLANLLGGTVRMQSEIGQGSVFTATVATGDLAGVPMIQLPELCEDAVGQQTSAEISLTCHILVVDDRRDIRFLSKSILRRAGAHVSEAEDGLVAIQRVTSALTDGGMPIDLILLDMQMPKLDGYDTALRLRKLGFTGPIIALTADAMQADMARCIEAGCNDHLSKPIDAQKLCETVLHFTTQSRC